MEQSLQRFKKEKNSYATYESHRMWLTVLLIEKLVSWFDILLVTGRERHTYSNHDGMGPGRILAMKLRILRYRSIRSSGLLARQDLSLWTGRSSDM